MMLVLTAVGLQERYEASRGLALVLVLLTGWGLVFTAWLNYLEAFVIHAWCEWCLGSATMVLILFLLAFADWRELAESEDGPIETEATTV
jgi:uncharacterized membrane protein